MSTGKMVSTESLDATLIAPCGMNCGICVGHLREKNRCAGCNSDDDAGKPRYAVPQKSLPTPSTPIVILSGLPPDLSLRRDDSEESPCRDETLR